MEIENFYTEIEMCELLGIGLKALQGRISRGTNHPPATRLGRGKYVFDKKLFNVWLAERQLLVQVRCVG